MIACAIRRSTAAGGSKHSRSDLRNTNVALRFGREFQGFNGSKHLLSMIAKYCYWSVATGPYGLLMEQCVRSARAAGVFQQFHVLADRPLEGCECYDALECDKANGLFKLHYLKVGMSRLSFDYFIWLDADTVFVRRPIDVLGPLGKSPIHVPLEVNLSVLRADADWKGVSVFALRDLFREQGVMNQVYLTGSAFWIVHRAAIDLVYDLALKFWHQAKEAGLLVGVSAALSYAMQILCADPERHLLRNAPALWAGNDSGNYDERVSDGSSWRWRHALATEPLDVHPAIVHLAGRSKGATPIPA